jgi:CRP-like cAMP-binding protein
MSSFSNSEDENNSNNSDNKKSQNNDNDNDNDNKSKNSENKENKENKNNDKKNNDNSIIQSENNKSLISNNKSINNNNTKSEETNSKNNTEEKKTINNNTTIHTIKSHSKKKHKHSNLKACKTLKQNEKKIDFILDPENEINSKKYNFNNKIVSKSFKEDERTKENLYKTYSLMKSKSQLLKSTSTSKSSSNENTSSSFSDSTSNSQKTENTYEGTNRRLIRREKICDTDSEDSGSEDEKKKNFIILPDNKFKKLWDSLIALVILYSSICTPYKIAFIDTNSSKEDFVDIIVDVLLGIDMILNFFSAYYDSEENLVKTRRKIIIKYLKGWFIIDFISIFPFYLIINNDKASSLTRLSKVSKIPKIYKLLKLTKLLRITKMSKKGNVSSITKVFLEKFKINANVEKLIFFLLTFILLAHLSTCFWYLVAKFEDLSPDSWVVRLGYIDSSNFQIYILSFYWTLMTVTTVGYGDVSAGTNSERIYNLFIMSFGVLMYSFTIGSLSSILATMDQKNEEMNQKLKILAGIKKEYNLDKDLYDKVRKVIKFDLSRNQKDKMEFLQELPNKLRIELSQIMHDKIVQNLNFFKEQPNDFFAYVAPLLKPVKFSQNDFLYKIEDMIDEMYFVTKGTIIFCLDKKYDEKEIKEIKKNNNFGEIEMCLNEKLRFNIKVKSRNSELFILKKIDFLNLTVNFKEFIKKFLYKSLMIYLKYNEERKKIIAEYDDMMRKIKEHNFGTVKKDFSILNDSQKEEKDDKIIEDILEYLDKNGITFEGKPDDENPKVLLEILKKETNKKKKEEIVSKIEQILNELYS